MNGMRLAFEKRGDRGTFVSDVDGALIEYDWSDERHYAIHVPGLAGRVHLIVWDHGGACIFHDGSMLVDYSSRRGRGNVHAALEYASKRWKLDRPAQLDLLSEVAS